MITYDRITKACKGKAYHATLRGPDVKVVMDAVNQGIDSRLEACFVVGRDTYEVKNGGPISGLELHCKISPESLPVLLRRMNETDKVEIWCLVYDILGSLGISAEIPFEIVSPVDKARSRA